jgi:hypothetical protein
MKFYNKEEYIIGFENTIAGYNSIKNFTKYIYILTNKNNTNYNYFKNKEVYLLEDYNKLF